VQALDPLTGTWSTPVATPRGLTEPGLVVGDRVVFLPFARDGEEVVGWWLDPVTLTWTAVMTDCGVWTGYATAAGSLVIDGASTFDVEDGTCHRLPASSATKRRGALRIWLGDRLLVWSGNRGEETPQRRSGYAFVPRTSR
jgi:hypothetical protein